MSDIPHKLQRFSLIMCSIFGGTVLNPDFLLIFNSDFNFVSPGPLFVVNVLERLPPLLFLHFSYSYYEERNQFQLENTCRTNPPRGGQHMPHFIPNSRVSSEISFVSKKPKLVSALTEQDVCFGCFALISKQGVSVFRNNRNKQKTNQNSSKFVKISIFLIPHTISSVCFGCFDTGLKHRNKPKTNFLVSQKTNQKTTETD